MCTKRMSSILLAFTVQISIVARADALLTALMDAGMAATEAGDLEPA